MVFLKCIMSAMLKSGAFVDYLKKYYLIVIAGFIFLSPLSVFAGEIVFEINDSNIRNESSFWGRGIDTASNKIAVKYAPAENQTVCKVHHKIRQFSNPTDEVLVKVYQGNVFNGTAVQIASSDTIPAIFIPAFPMDYVVFELNNCLDLVSGNDYYFEFSRTQLNSANGYISGLSPFNSSNRTTWLTQSIFFNGGWEERLDRDWSFRLEGPDPQKEPVLIIPGIAGSELKNGEDLIWADLSQMFIDINDQFLTENLSLDANGDPLTNIEVGEAIEQLPDVPIIDIGAFNIDTFKSLKEELEKDGYSRDENLFFFPYDWRLDLSGTADLLEEKIEEIKTQTGSDKINIIAHSMGGLLAKEYIRQKGKDSIDKLIFVGTPHVGAPKAGKTVIFGDRMGIPWLEEDRIKEIGENSIALHELLPSQQYFDTAGAYIKDSSGNFLDFSATKNFLISRGSSETVFNYAENFLSNNLENTDFSGIDVYNIAGCNLDTDGGYELKANGNIAHRKYQAGDKTVPIVSADFISIPLGNKFYALDSVHAELPSRPGVRDLIVDILSNENLGVYENLSSDFSNCGIEGQELIWRSPVEVHVYDEEGRHTGPITNNGFEYGIPEVSYEIIGHEKFLFVPTNNGKIYNIVAKGLDEGTFDLSVRQNNNGVVSGAVIFNDVPVTISTDVKFNVDGPNYPESIQIDEDNDGVFETFFATAVLEGEESGDVTPPVINIVSPASLSYERSFLLPLEISSEDDNSGILNFQILFDDQPASSTVDLFFYNLGSHTLNVFADDRAGNNASSSFTLTLIATPDSTISDIERAFELGWIEKKGNKNSLIQKLNTAIRVEKKIELLEEKLPGKPKVVKRIERLEKRLDKVLGAAFLKQFEKEYNKGNINQQAHSLLKEDIEWLLK